MGAITANQFNTIAVGYTESSPGTCPAVAFAIRETADPPGTFQAPVLAFVSGAPYNPPGTGITGPGSDRWGDYSACVVDPDVIACGVSQQP